MLDYHRSPSLSCKIRKSLPMFGLGKFEQARLKEMSNDNESARPKLGELRGRDNSTIDIFISFLSPSFALQL
ncbi:MAG: hypothetical protein MUC48_23715 [Leptolyngbya sp. Prado105]|nr:hypothetical protein [Leptolyngbya sp. Prado105]